jgi:uncharacterized membrane protein
VSDPLRADPPVSARPDQAVASAALHPPWAFRGTDFGRIFGLSDGIFAFSMTLLVLSLALPVAASGATVTGPAVTQYLQSGTFRNALFAYVISFFVIAAWWRTHHMQFGYLRSYDRRLMQLNTLFLIFIAILPFAAEVLNASGTTGGEIFFAGIQIATGLALAGTWTYAAGMGHLAPELPKAWERYITWTTFTVPVVFAVSIPIALVWPSYAMYVWVGVFLIPAALRRRVAT